MPLLPRTLLLLDEPFMESQGTYYCPAGSTLWRFAVKFAEHCESFTFYVPLERNTAEPQGPVAHVNRFRVVGRPYYEAIKDYYRHLPRTQRKLKEQARQLVAEHDLIIFRVPAPAAKYSVREATQMGKPLVMLVAGDVTKQSRWVADRTGPIAWAGRLATGLLRRQEHEFARRCVFVGTWGDELREVFLPDCPRVEVCQDPNITRAQLTHREDTCLQQPTRLVRVCRLLSSKGLEYLFEAIAKLIDSGKPIKLDLAGGGDDPAYVQSLHDLAKKLGLADQITFHGTLAFGEKLFNLFRNADIHVISSLGEGLPRIIAEGRAFSLPTVATSVGGIPSVVHDGEDGLLVPPSDADALAVAIGRIIDDHELRRRIIARSWEIAQQSTAEYHAEKLAQRIADAMVAAGSGRP
ncbi:MAG: glycosyltransferase [Phycisphaerae bacterium]|nr:glycosyltransferase [Phycisphaerae bacterium]